jgi:hypothetical protein
MITLLLSALPSETSIDFEPLESIDRPGDGSVVTARIDLRVGRYRER